MSSGAALTAAHLERAAYVYIRQPCFELEEYAGASVHAMRPCRGASSELARNQAHFTRAAQRLCRLRAPSTESSTCRASFAEIDIARPELARQCLEHGVTLLDRRAVTVDRFIVAPCGPTSREPHGPTSRPDRGSRVTGAIRHHGGPISKPHDDTPSTRRSSMRSSRGLKRSASRPSSIHHAPSPYTIDTQRGEGKA